MMIFLNRWEKNSVDFAKSIAETAQMLLVMIIILIIISVSIKFSHY